MSSRAALSIYYNGNQQIKKAGVQQEYSAEEVEEYIKCSTDIIYFIHKYVKIISLDEGIVFFDMWDYQERMISTFQDNRFSICLLPRQMGKTITVAAYLLHYIIFNPHKAVGILANRGATAREILSRMKRMLENLPFFLQPGVRKYNEGSIEFGNDSSIMAEATSNDAIRGYSFNCVVGDTNITICDDYDRIYKITIDKANSSKYTYSESTNLWRNTMYYTVYRITNQVNGKEYIGYHQTNNIEDGYMGSGKLIKRAIEKYGIENFTKDYIEIFEKRDDAEALEAELVNEDYTLDDSTYNICVGGNVRIMVGDNNPFKGKEHTDIAKLKMSEYHSGKNVTIEDDIIIDSVRYNSFAHAKNKLELSTKKLINLIVADGNGYVDNGRQEKLISQLEEIENRKKDNRVAISIGCSNRFRGVSKSEEHKTKISVALTGKKKSDEHVNKINRNPEKIKKTADKHRGMKRGTCARKNMSAAKKGKSPHNKGKVYCYNPITLDKQLCLPEDIPIGYKKGYIPKELRNA